MSSDHRRRLAKLFLAMWAIGAAMVLGSALRATFGPLSLAHAGETGPVDHPTAHGQVQPELVARLDLDPGAPAVPFNVVVFPVKGNIDLGLSAFLDRSLSGRSDIQLAVLEINTFGGRVDAAVQMRDLLMETDIPTVAYVHPRAISAGALIALACDVIAVSPGSSMGAATPIQVQGGEAAPVEAKYVSYLRGEFRSTAESHGRDGAVAEAMVDAAVEVEGLVTTEELLTLDDGQALSTGIADIRVEQVAELLAALGLDAATRETPEISWAERLVRFLTDPIVGGLLMSIGMLGIAIELYSPGVGLPGGVGVTCLALFFFGHFMTHLAGIEEIVLIAIGLLLLALEAFVIPGFGAAGIAGLIVLSLGLILALVGLDIRVSMQTGDLWMAALRVMASLGLAVMAFAAFLYVAPQSRFGKWLVLKATVRGEASRRSVRGEPKLTDEELMGRRGVTLSDLRPSGTARFGAERVDVLSEGNWVPKGTDVKVVEVRGNRVVVRPVDDDA